jgi:proteasome beta subunit
MIFAATEFFNSTPFLLTVNPGMLMSQEMLWMPGASTVGVVCKDGVILASEKRLTMGYMVTSRAGRKVFKITDHVGTACAGLVSDMQMLTKEIAALAKLYELNIGRAISVRSAAKIMSNILFERRLFPLFTQTIVGGVDETGPSLYVLDLLGSLIEDKFATVGTGSEVAIGVLEAGYREGLSLDEAKELVVKAIRSAIARDAASGDGIDVMTITREGVREETLPAR